MTSPALSKVHMLPVVSLAVYMRGISGGVFPTWRKTCISTHEFWTTSSVFGGDFFFETVSGKY